MVLVGPVCWYILLLMEEYKNPPQMMMWMVKMGIVNTQDVSVRGSSSRAIIMQCSEGYKQKSKKKTQNGQHGIVKTGWCYMLAILSLGICIEVSAANSNFGQGS